MLPARGSNTRNTTHHHHHHHFGKKKHTSNLSKSGMVASDLIYQQLSSNLTTYHSASNVGKLFKSQTKDARLSG